MSAPECPDARCAVPCWRREKRSIVVDAVDGGNGEERVVEEGV